MGVVFSVKGRVGVRVLGRLNRLSEERVSVGGVLVWSGKGEEERR